MPRSKYYIFTSHNSGDHTLTIHTTVGSVSREIKAMHDIYPIQTLRGANSGHEKMKVGESVWYEFSDSTWMTIFRK